MPRRLPLLTTIGYEGSDVAELIRALQADGVTRLVDVRAVSNSRKRGFSKHVLSRHLAEHGIAYTHLKALGTPKAGRDAARAGDLAGLQRIFAGQLALPEAQAALGEATELAKQETICLLCYEAEPEGCHRRIVADEIAKRGGPAVRHLHPLPLSLKSLL